MSLKEWAKREVDLLCEKESPDHKEGEWDYGRACYESALKAFNSLLDAGHSGMSIKITKRVLDRLIDGKPLTPIEDTPDEWRLTFDLKEKKTYQSKRMTSLFKEVRPDGSVSFHETDRIICNYLNEPVRFGFYSGFVSKIVEEYIGPIKMPYMPYDRPTKVYVDEFLYDKKNGGDYDTLAIYYGIDPGGNKIYINRYFKEVPNGWEEINLAEFNSRCVGDLDDGEDL